MAVVPVEPQSAVVAAAPGVRLERSMSYETWRLLGAGLGARHDTSCWVLGDWAAFGRARYGRFYRDALVATRVDQATLGGYAAVARRFAPERRRTDLTFRHHAEVCGVGDDDLQDAWLAAAAAGRWSWKELHRRLRAAGGTPPGEEQRVLVEADEAQAERWRKAASNSRCALDEWIARALDRAAASPALGH